MGKEILKCCMAERFCNVDGQSDFAMLYGQRDFAMLYEQRDCAMLNGQLGLLCN